MDLPDLSSLAGAELSDEQLQGMLQQIDLDITNLLRDGKLAALRYGLPGEAGQQIDRAENLKALIAARAHYERLLQSRPVWRTSQARPG